MRRALSGSPGEQSLRLYGAGYEKERGPRESTEAVVACRPVSREFFFCRFIGDPYYQQYLSATVLYNDSIEQKGMAKRNYLQGFLEMSTKLLSNGLV